MSVILVTEKYETVRKTIHHLRLQTVRDWLELVLVVPSIEEAALIDSELREFYAYHAAEVGPIKSLSWARASGVRHATAPIVAFAESHAYPAPNWAEALIAAHQEAWAAVGPGMGNANSGGMISWANFFLDYGRWFEIKGGEVMDDVPGRNSSYKRDLLLGYGMELERMLEAESVMHLDLQARGFQLYLEPKAKTYHLNVARVAPWLTERFHAGRSYAAARARAWRWVQRVVYIGGAPLIPFVRLSRTLKDVQRSGLAENLSPKILPFLFASLVVSTVGEMFGYAFGCGNALQKLSESELYKVRYVTERDRRTLAC